jgi:hypothetical protein
MLPADFEQNRRAAMENNLKGFTPEVRELMQLTMRTESGEMTKKGKDKTKKAVGRKETANSFLYTIYAGNNKTRYTDEQIQKMVRKQFPSAKCYKDINNVKRMRGRLNSGRVEGYKVIGGEIKKYGDDTPKKAVKKVVKKKSSAKRKKVLAKRKKKA